MTLDIHIAMNMNEAGRSERVLYFPEKLHDIVFTKQDRWIKQFDRFYRLADYYKDTFYVDGDIYVLKKQLDRIGEQTECALLKSFANAFGKVCAEAISQGLNIYCFCD